MFFLNRDANHDRFVAAGVAQGAEFRVSTATLADQHMAAVAFRVNSAIDGSQVLPAVAMDAAGNFVVTWESPFDSDDIQTGNIQAKLFDAMATSLLLGTSNY